MNSIILNHPEQVSRVSAFLSGLDFSKTWEVKWGQPRRTNKQNNYLWGVVYPTLAEGLSEEYKAHITSDHVHEICKKHFMPKIEVPGIKTIISMSTTELCRSGNKDAFQDYVLRIQEMAARKGIYIPDPNE